jgi:hypothetical protein
MTPMTPTTVAWIRWYRRHGVPADHIAALVGRDAGKVEAFLRGDRPGDAPPEPWAARNGCRPAAPLITCGSASSRVRALHELGYPAARIAELVGTSEGRVSDFLRRSLDGRGRWRARPLRLSEYEARIAHRAGAGARRAAAAERAARRRSANKARCTARYEAERAERAARREAAIAAGWADGPAEAGCPHVVRRPCDIPGPEPAPAREPNPWEGSASFHAGRELRRSSAGLTRDKVLEIAELRRGGMSMPAIARRYGVDRNTIWNIVSGRTWGGLGRAERDPTRPPASTV